MKNWLGRFSEIAYLLLRVIVGVMFACHGSQKLFGFPPGGPGSLPPVMVFAGIVELVCGLLMAVGLLTSLAAFLASGEMAVAYFVVHAKQSFWPVVNQGELAVAYCFLFLYIATRGGGRYALDNVFGDRQSVT